jgi:thiol-disulfide isomerase/thioredoxin
MSWAVQSRVQLNSIRSLLSGAALILSCSLGPAQAIHVELTRISGIDDEGLHLLVFSPSPKSPLVLPRIDTSGAGFFEVFYSWNIKGNPEIAVMRLPSRNGERLYIDLNNNRDLTDDGPPAFFPYTQNDFSFEVFSPFDRNQRTRFLLQRSPDLPDSSRVLYVDSSGNLNPRFARFWGGTTGHLSYTGTRGTFYFDRRLNLRRGTVSVGSVKHEIGLFDYDNNGLFNEKDDVLLIDLDRDGQLCYYRYAFCPSDVFTLDSLRFTVDQADPYGRWVRLAATTRPLTPYLPQKYESLRQETQGTGTIDQAIWNIATRTLDGDTIALNQFRGKYLLLNFWGEWCKPCLDEIPLLVQASTGYRSKDLTIVSFLKSYNLEKARALVRSHAMSWPQLILTETTESLFRVRAYPTNILILPNGKYYLQVGSMQKSFLESHLR